ncbi:MAG: hypothetical protein DHS20C15_16160 [Planctomycetota bacterium]|nr:MAG: hypothetical protein DHS20C15_16160 [Planctomycetota bacterium]
MSAINPPAMACEAFAIDISSLVDGELESAPTARLVEHMDACSSCRDAFDAFRRLSRLGRLAAEDLDAQIVERVDPRKLFAGVTRCLVDDHTAELSALFYELGKAYAYTANRALEERERQSVLGAKRAIAIRGGELHAKRLLREAEGIERVGEHRRPSGSLFRGSRRLFAERGDAHSGAGPVKTAMERARRFLEESLALQPERSESRLWLGFVHALQGRHDRARLEFRRVYLEGNDVVHRLMALQSLGKLHSVEGDYRRAAECFREVVEHQGAESEPGLFASFLNLPVNCAKAGLHDESVSHFAELTRRFPARVSQIRGLLARKSQFQRLLHLDPRLRADLSRSVPTLFAA